MKNKTALITGASSGIGMELAKIHASKGGNLVIVARSADKLNELKSKLENSHNIKVTVIAKDLGMPTAADEIYESIKQEGIEVDYLINNAGFGGRGFFHERDMELDMQMLQVNVVVLTKLTRLFLPDFVKRGSGRILNVSSMAALMPGPLQAVYYATKAYVTSFSNAISEELKNTGVTVTSLMPGATKTGFADTADMRKTPAFANMQDPTTVASAGYKGMLDGELNVYAGLSVMQRLATGIMPLMPRKMMLKTVMGLQTVK